PNPTSVSRKGYMKITNLPFNTSIDRYCNLYSYGGICKIFIMQKIQPQYLSRMTRIKLKEK
ncbi:MAG: hypothetical protein LBT07_00750, partial [Endomicrobium sp.]|nr:hypothetical protein [Endomicrobium sp.]